MFKFILHTFFYCRAIVKKMTEALKYLQGLCNFMKFNSAVLKRNSRKLKLNSGKLKLNSGKLKLNSVRKEFCFIRRSVG